MKKTQTLSFLVICTCNSIYAQCNFPISFSNTTSSAIASYFGQNPVVSQNFSLTGTLTIDVDITFDHVNIDMSGSTITKIVVNTGKSLTIKGASNLKSCNGVMWQGITVNSGNSCTTLNIIESSKIEDAENAVSVPHYSGVILNIDGAGFNKNYKHIVANGPFSLSCNNFTIKNSQFLCQQNGANGNALLSPHAGQRTYYGLDIRNFASSYITIGPSNTIDFADYGIYVEHSNLNVINNTINNNLYHIHDYFDGFLNASNNIFNSATKLGTIGGNGIEASFNVDVIVDANIFNDNDIGCNLFDRLLNVSIINNRFINSRILAVQMVNTYYSGLGLSNIDLIHHNEINPGSLNANGILWSETNQPPIAGSSAEIYQNTFNRINNAIECINIKNCKIYDNPSIRLSQGNGFGIKVQNCPSIKVTNNYINGPVPTVQESYCNYTSRGIINDGSIGAIIRCNSVNFVNKGFQFINVTKFNSFQENIMGQCKYQFYLLNNPGMGIISKGNASASNNWYGSNAWCSSYFNTYSQNSGGQNTQFRACAGCPPTLNGFVNGTPCVKINSSQISVFSYCGNAITNGNRLAELQELVNNPDLWDPNADPSQWLLREYILNELEANDSIVNTDSLLTAIQLLLKETNISTLRDLLNSIAELSNDSTIDPDSLRDANNNIYPTQLAEENYIIINEILIDANAHGYSALTTNQINTITEIAGECPLEGGSAVYIARAMLIALGYAPSDYDEACNNYAPPAQKLTHNSSLEIIKSVVDIYPIPAHNSININYSEVEKNAVIEILQADSKVTMKCILPADKLQTTIDISSLKRGVYEVIIKNRNNILMQKRIIIM